MVVNIGTKDMVINQQMCIPHVLCCLYILPYGPRGRSRSRFVGRLLLPAFLTPFLNWIAG